MVTVGTRVVGPLNGEDGRTSTTPIDFITADFEFQEVLFFWKSSNHYQLLVQEQLKNSLEITLVLL